MKEEILIKILKEISIGFRNASIVPEAGIAAHQSLEKLIEEYKREL